MPWNMIHPKVSAAAVVGFIAALIQQVLLHSHTGLHLTGAEQSYVTLASAAVAGYVKSGPYGSVAAEITKTVVDTVTALAPVPTPPTPQLDVGQIAPVDAPPSPQAPA